MLVDKRHRLHILVWDFRQKYSYLWATPDRTTSAHFALTEAAEVIEAFLRIQPEYSRNNPGKQVNMHKELGDTAMMLITFLGEKYKDPWDFWDTSAGIARPLGVETIVTHVVKAWLWLMERPAGDPALYESEIWKALQAIDLYTGDVEDLVNGTLQNIFSRHIEPYLPDQLFGQHVTETEGDYMV